MFAGVKVYQLLDLTTGSPQIIVPPEFSNWSINEFDAKSFVYIKEIQPIITQNNAGVHTIKIAAPYTIKNREYQLPGSFSKMNEQNFNQSDRARNNSTLSNTINLKYALVIKYTAR